ncbi:MAG: energy transducer TonB [Nibricoccus sp.]
MKRFMSLTALFCAMLAALIANAADAIIEDVEQDGTGKVLPKVISQPAPVCPQSLVRSGVSGKVIVTFTVDENGDVKDVAVASSTQRQLNPYAIKAVGAWKFEAGTRNGKPAAFRLRSAVDFAAHDQAAEPKSNLDPKDSALGLKSVPVVKKKAPAIYPYEIVVNGKPAWADASFVVDYAGRPLFTVAASASDRAFARAAVAMVEASEYTPGKRGAYRVMSPANEHFQFDGELSLDPESRRILAELRKPNSTILPAADLDERPKLVKQVAPAYPRALKDDGLIGQAEIEFVISRDGTVMFPRIVSATHEDFGWAASVAVAQWRYQPPQKGGRPVAVRMTVPILFTAQRLAEAD